MKNKKNTCLLIFEDIFSPINGLYWVWNPIEHSFKTMIAFMATIYYVLFTASSINLLSEVLINFDKLSLWVISFDLKISLWQFIFISQLMVQLYSPQTKVSVESTKQSYQTSLTFLSTTLGETRANWRVRQVDDMSTFRNLLNQIGCSYRSISIIVLLLGEFLCFDTSKVKINEFKKNIFYERQGIIEKFSLI